MIGFVVEVGKMNVLVVEVTRCRVVMSGGCDCPSLIKSVCSVPSGGSVRVWIIAATALHASVSATTPDLPTSGNVGGS